MPRLKLGDKQAAQAGGWAESPLPWTWSPAGHQHPPASRPPRLITIVWLFCGQPNPSRKDTGTATNINRHPAGWRGRGGGKEETERHQGTLVPHPHPEADYRRHSRATSQKVREVRDGAARGPPFSLLHTHPAYPHVRGTPFRGAVHARPAQPRHHHRPGRLGTHSGPGPLPSMSN